MILVSNLHELIAKVTKSLPANCAAAVNGQVRAESFYSAETLLFGVFFIPPDLVDAVKDLIDQHRDGRVGTEEEI